LSPKTGTPRALSASAKLAKALAARKESMRRPLLSAQSFLIDLPRAALRPKGRDKRHAGILNAQFR
jgi:hypothetical protein